MRKHILSTRQTRGITLQVSEAWTRPRRSDTAPFKPAFSKMEDMNTWPNHANIASPQEAEPQLLKEYRKTSAIDFLPNNKL